MVRYCIDDDVTVYSPLRQLYCMHTGHKDIDIHVSDVDVSDNDAHDVHLVRDDLDV
jgi:hypothetical protein